MRQINTTKAIKFKIKSSKYSYFVFRFYKLSVLIKRNILGIWMKAFWIGFAWFCRNWERLAWFFLWFFWRNFALGKAVRSIWFCLIFLKKIMLRNALSQVGFLIRPCFNWYCFFRRKYSFLKPLFQKEIFGELSSVFWWNLKKKINSKMPKRQITRPILKKCASNVPK